MTAVESLRSSHPAFDGEVAAWRDAALTAFQATGFPTRRLEAWKYTPTRQVAGTSFVHTADVAAFEAAALKAYRITEADELVLVNGVLSPDHCSPGLLDALPEGVRLVSRALARDGSDCPFPMLAASDGAGFTDLNAAFLQEGLWLDIAPSAKLERPIHLIHVSVAKQQATAAHVRHHLHVGRSSTATVMETHVTLGEASTLSNVVTEVHLEANAELRHHVIGHAGLHGMHVGRVVARTHRDARFHSHVAWLGGALVRNQIEVHLVEPGAHCALHGLYVLDGEAHVDNHTVIEHAAPDCTSLEHYKGVLGGKARGIFDGKVVVAKDAQRTSAEQSNDNLLLSDTADANAKPQLEIYADDVKCSHGTTVGQLDKTQLNYLRTRGIPEMEARNLLTAAFVADRIDQIANEQVRTHTRGLVDATLQRILSEGAD